MEDLRHHASKFNIQIVYLILDDFFKGLSLAYDSNFIVSYILDSLLEGWVCQ